MSVRHYRLLPALAASLSLLVAGCSSDPVVATAPSAQTAAPQTAAPQTAAPQTAASDRPDEMDTESTIFTVFGLAKRPSERTKGPLIGDQVSPLLWEATHDSLDFVKIVSEDPMTGVLMTDWYSPPGKPNERLRVSVFVLSRALRSDSLSVTIDRQERAASGEWKNSSIARDAVAELENAILLRARHIRAERYRDTS